MHRGYIKVWRKIEDSFFYKNSKYVHLWIHLLFMANHKPNNFLWNGKKQVCERGQFITGRNTLISETGISGTTIERILEAIESGHLIGQRKNNKFRLITILNYGEHQGNTGQQTDNKRTSNGHLTDTNKNEEDTKKNEKEVDVKSKPDCIFSDSKDFLGKEKENQQKLNDLLKGTIKTVRV
jgi:hypothetical protein